MVEIEDTLTPALGLTHDVAVGAGADTEDEDGAEDAD
jgi:hypothetical protein